MNNFFTKVVRKRGGESNPVVIAYKGGSHLKIPKKGGMPLEGGVGPLFKEGGVV